MDATHVSIERQFFESYEWRAETFTRGQAWVDLLAMADAQGQIETSKLSLAKRWDWGREKVLHVLREWENRQRIRQHPTPMLTVIEILNYDCHQATSQATQKQAETTVKSGAEKAPKEPVEFSKDVEKMFAWFCDERQVKPKSAAIEVDWKHAIRLTIDRDKRDKREMGKLIRWVSQDIEEPRPGSTWTGWRAQIRSPAKFREKYEQLLERSKVAAVANGAPQAAPKPYKAPTAAERKADERRIAKELRGSEKQDDLFDGGA